MKIFYLKKLIRKFLLLVENSIIISIHDATSSYVPCKANSCSCFTDVIKSDLEPFQSGITREMIDSVRSKGIVYQIIDNQIYRQKDCNFPARCSGVEYFIKKTLRKVKLKDMELVINVRDYPQVMENYGPQGPVLSFSKTGKKYF